MSLIVRVRQELEREKGCKKKLKRKNCKKIDTKYYKM